MKRLLLLLFLVTPCFGAEEIDYFGEFEKLYIHKLNPPEDNGLRLMIAAIGPRILEQAALADAVPRWEDMPTHEYGKFWFENRWKPLCEHLSIDPYKKPMFYDSLPPSYFSWMHSRENEGKGIPGDENGQKLYDKLIAAPWKAEEYPEVAEVLQKRNVILDYFGHCVRKPNYVCWRQRAEEGMYGILLPDVQAQRDFARDLQVRVTYRIGAGDSEGAWYDIMSMLTLARKHYKNDPIIVINLVGAAVERMGYDAAKILVKHGNLSKDQLLRFSKELDALPLGNSWFDGWITERYMLFDFCRRFNTDLKEQLSGYENISGQRIIERLDKILEKLGDKPINQEIARNRILQLQEKCKAEQITFEEIFSNRLLLCQYMENLHKKIARAEEVLDKQIQVADFSQEETRSQIVADTVFALFAPALGAVGAVYNNCDSELTLLKIAVALERYKHDHGDYPETLEALLLTYLEEIPIDPSTSRSTITYKKDGEKFLLYSYGPNQKDDGGQADPNRHEGDIVF